MHPNGWTWCRYFLEPGLYAAYLSRIQRHFDSDRLKIMLYDDLCTQPEAFIQDYYAWLGVEAGFEPSCLHHHINPDAPETDPDKLSSPLREFMQEFYRQRFPMWKFKGIWVIVRPNSTGKDLTDGSRKFIICRQFA